MFSRMRLYTGLVLSECSCIMAGLGSFPTVSRPRPGQGPSRPELLPDVTDTERAENCPIDQETVHSSDEWAIELAPTMRAAYRGLNMTVQHWLVFVVYTRFPYKVTPI